MPSKVIIIDYGSQVTPVSYTHLITNIMLTQCLRELEAAGLVRRDDFGEVPPRVEYSLTGQGRELLPALRELYKWGEKQLARSAEADPPFS